MASKRQYKKAAAQLENRLVRCCGEGKKCKQAGGFDLNEALAYEDDEYVVNAE
ncbi:vacuolar protein sorting-associated protein [Corchorus olitorius]|uniref:Vacuolar protein sorting-associated protein n=1 Tax=Corchorus olitorius TaxID=93759 RepID=A0A1R3I3J5_9ROSI|nr:vacuolar protein sorting-associated protein [Corchorus olitorius]